MPFDPYATATSALPAAITSQIPGNIVGLNITTINTSELNMSSIEGGALYGYSGTPGPGNLYFALSPSGGTDAFGNTLSTGINVLSGSIQGAVLTGVSMDSTSTLTGTNIAQASVLNPSIAGGTAASLVATMTNTSGAVLGYTSGSTAVTYATNGVYSWTCPTGVTSIQVQCWAAGGGGSGSSSSEGGPAGGGGEYAAEPSYAVTPGNVYTVSVGQGGSSGVQGVGGGNGGNTEFYPAGGGGLSVIANGGQAYAGSFLGGAGGSGSTNTVHFDGGDGANGSGFTGGAGGGGSASPAGEGNDGTSSTSSTGGAGGAAITGGGAGGAGGNDSDSGTNGSSPGGGGGGEGSVTALTGSYSYTPAAPAANGTYSYYGFDAMNGSPNGLRNHDGVLYQGQWEVDSPQGYQYSVITLPYADIQADLSGLTVTAVTLLIHNLHCYYSNTGMWIELSYTSVGSWGNTGTSAPAGLTAVSNFYITPGETLTQNLGLNGGIGVALQNGNCKSLYIGPGDYPSWGWWYGYQDSGANGGVAPELTVYYSSTSVTGGTGGNGQVVITYNSTTPTYTLSVSANASTDVFGNPYSAGFTGPLLTLTNSSSTPATNTSATAINANTAGTPTVTNSQGFTGQMASNTVDDTPVTVTTTTYSPLSKAYTIPAGDGQVGTVYRLTAWGDLDQPTTAQSASWAVIAYGNTLASATWGQAEFTVSTTYEWYLTAIAQVIVTGSSGTVRSWLSGTMGLFGENLGSITALYGGAITGALGNTLCNIASVSTIGLQGKFATAETGLAMHCQGSILERLGP